MTRWRTPCPIGARNRQRLRIGLAMPAWVSLLRVW